MVVKWWRLAWSALTTGFILHLRALKRVCRVSIYRLEKQIMPMLVHGLPDTRPTDRCPASRNIDRTYAEESRIVRFWLVQTSPLITGSVGGVVSINGLLLAAAFAMAKQAARRESERSRRGDNWPKLTPSAWVENVRSTRGSCVR